MDKHLSSAKESQEGMLSRVQKAFCLFLIFLGIFICLERYLAADIPAGALIALAGTSAVMTEIMCRGRMQKLIILPLSLFFCGLFFICNQTALAEGGKEIANQVIYLVNRHYQTEYLYWFVEQKEGGKAGAFLLLCSLFGCMEGFLVSLFQKKRSRNLALLSVPFLVFTAGILVGRTPIPGAALFVLAGFLAYQLDWKLRGTWILGIGMAAVLVLAVFWGKSDVAQQILETYHEPYLQRQLDFENKMLELAGRFGQIELFLGSKAQKEYVLTNEEPDQAGKEVFQITMDERPEQNIYIRGFIGGDYEGGSWKSVSAQEFSDWARQQGLSNQECQQAVQNFPYWSLEKQKTGGRIARQVAMELKTDVPGYTLVPYYTRIPEDQSARGDGSLAPGSEHTLQWDSFLYTESWRQQGFLPLEEWQQTEGTDIPAEGTDMPAEETDIPAEGMDIPAEEIWESYGSYVQQAYTRLPEQGLENLRKLAEEYEGKSFLSSQDAALESEERNSQDEAVESEEGSSRHEALESEEGSGQDGTLGMENGNGQDEALESEKESGQSEAPEREDGGDILITVEETGAKIQQVTELLWQNADYSQNLEPLPEGEDYAEYFLLKQKKGFCVHFATAGTLVFRMYGVPARYVSGYVVFPEDFKENSDGTFTAAVTDERGHAWTEIFQKGTGFYPLEVTPPAYFTAVLNLQPGERLEDALQKWQEKEAAEGSEKEGEPEPEQEDSAKKQEPEPVKDNGKEQQPKPGENQAEEDSSKGNAQTGKKEKMAIQKAGAGIAICLVGALLLILLLYQKRKRQEKRRRAEFFQEDFKKGALAFGGSMGRMLESLGLGQKKDMSDLEYGAFLERELPGMEWERIIFLLQKAAFSEHGITKEEFQAVARAHEELAKKAGSGKP